MTESFNWALTNAVTLQVNASLHVNAPETHVLTETQEEVKSG